MALFGWLIMDTKKIQIPKAKIPVALRGNPDWRIGAGQGLEFDRNGGGEGGIRTHDPVFNRIPLFESGAFSHSATSPICLRCISE